MMLGMAEMTSLVNQGITGSQIQNRDEPGAQSRAPILQQHSGDAARGDAADQVSATSHGGRGGGRGGSGWARYHPADTSPVRFPGRAQGGALEMVTEHDIPGRHATPGWHRETRARYGDNNVPATRLTHRGGENGGWDSDGGSDVSASGAASHAVPLQPETMHFGMAQSPMGHALPQIQNQVAGRLPSDMMHVDDMIRDGGELQHDMDVQQLLLAINWDTLGRSELDLPTTFAGASPHHHVPPLALNLDTLGQSEIVMPGDDTGMDGEVATEPAAVQVAGSRTSRRGQIVFNLDADRSETMDLDPDPTRVGPGAGVGTHIAAGGMAGASLSTYSGRQQASGPGPGGADVPLQNVTVTTGMFPATMEQELPQVQQQATAQTLHRKRVYRSRGSGQSKGRRTKYK